MEEGVGEGASGTCEAAIIQLHQITFSYTWGYKAFHSRSIRIADRRGFWKATMLCKSYSIEEPWLLEV